MKEDEEEEEGSTAAAAVRGLAASTAAVSSPSRDISSASAGLTSNAGDQPCQLAASLFCVGGVWLPKGPRLSSFSRRLLLNESPIAQGWRPPDCGSFDASSFFLRLRRSSAWSALCRRQARWRQALAALSFVAASRARRCCACASRRRRRKAAWMKAAARSSFSSSSRCWCSRSRSVCFTSRRCSWMRSRQRSVEYSTAGVPVLGFNYRHSG